MTTEKTFTISIKLYGHDGRKLEHKEFPVPFEFDLNRANYIFQRLVDFVKAGMKAP